MKLSSRQLKAFAVTAQTLNFSKAALQLHITQSALSQRIQKLEDRLKNALFIRGAGGIKLTNIGEHLLRYCTTQAKLEEEFLIHTGLSDYQKLVGTIRIAGFSTIMESLVIPELVELLQKAPQLNLELHSMELRELMPALEEGKVDFIITQAQVPRPEIDYELLGYELNVLITSATQSCPDDVFLDHDYEDTMTSNFWRMQHSGPESWRTFYLDNIHMILAGVKMGLGKAIVPIHLIQKDAAYLIMDEFNPYPTPVYLASFKGNAQTLLHQSLKKYLSCISKKLSK
ncbi:LysR family transporter transcriptional regulator [Legionella moravica]|uniref:Transcriptional regulator n=1 Tax=Legionella moravica TaxID=39962 RepID=A0A378JX24_9GAMM|nr:LysR family transcriptional regulator [Legionella moravica]KTD35342.1 LysR family transporter transcriptional regulator [Legionella moravica]STX61948.1 transcriptional regulator [Legionella moravica]